MKKFIYILGFVLFTLVSCEKNDIDNPDSILKYDYASVVSQNRVSLAKRLIEAFDTNPYFASTVITECNKKFDGDRNVLCKSLFEISTPDNSKVSNIINNSLQVRKSKSTINDNFTSSIITQDSLIQIYYYISEGCDSTSFEGIVVKPGNYVEGEKSELLVIKKDGSFGYIRSDVDPDKNYLVISNNERSDLYENIDKRAPHSQPLEISSSTTVDGKIMKIVRAKFTSISAKRTVEDWIDGEPEVRLNVIYALIDPITKAIKESRNSSFMYAKDWIKNGLFVNSVKWNNTLIECPYWLSDEKNYGRRLLWTEEDGTSSEKTTETSFTDKTTGITTKTTVKTPATNKDKLIADSWIDYELVGEGAMYAWGILQFEVSCK